MGIYFFKCKFKIYQMKKLQQFFFGLLFCTVSSITTIHSQEFQLGLDLESKTGGNGLEISFDGKYFLTSSDYGAICVWSLNDGRKIKEIFSYEYYNSNNLAVFSPNSQNILVFRMSEYEDLKVDVWNIVKGEKIDEINLSKVSNIKNISNIKFNSSGNLVAIYDGFAEIFICNTKNFKCTKTINVENAEFITGEMEFTSDNKQLIFANFGNIYSSVINKSTPYDSIYTNVDFSISDWCINKNEVIILTSEIDSLLNFKNYFNILDYRYTNKTVDKRSIEIGENYLPKYSFSKEGNLIMFCEAKSEEDNPVVFLFDNMASEPIKKIPLNNVKTGYSVHTNYSGDFILVDMSSQIHILDSETLEVKSLISDNPSDLRAKLHPNKKYYFTLNNGILNSWKLETGEHHLNHLNVSDSSDIIDFFINPLNGNLVYNTNNNIYISSFPEGRLIQKISLKTERINQIQCSHKEDFFIVSYDSIIQIYNSSGLVLKEHIIPDGTKIQKVFISPNDKMVALHTANSISLYKIESNQSINIINLEEYSNDTPQSFSPDSKILVIKKFRYPVNYLFVDTESCNIVDSLEVSGGLGGGNFLFAPDGYSFCTDNSSFFSLKYDEYNSYADDICFGELYPYAAGSVSNCFKSTWSKYGYPIKFSDNGYQIYFGYKNLIEIRNSYYGNTKHQLNWHRGSINSIDQLSDSRLIVSTSQDGSLIIWDATTGEGLIKQFFFGEKLSECTYYSKKGEYNTSLGNTNELYWTDGLQINKEIEQKNSLRNITLWHEKISSLLKQDSIDIETKRVQEIYDNQNNEIKNRIIEISQKSIMGNVADADGKKYPTINIKGDVWMTENLATRSFNNGDVILEVKDLIDWQKAIDNKIPAYLIDKQNPELGKIYNRYAVIDPRGIAPQGMIVPSDKISDWNRLNSSYLTLTKLISKHLFLGEFINSKGYNVDCFKSESNYIHTSKETETDGLYSINSHGIWWLLDNSELSFSLSRCTGMDGEYFMGYGSDYTDTLKSYDYGFYVRCVTPLKRFNNMQIAMETKEKVKYLNLNNYKVDSDSLFQFQDLEYLELSNCDLSAIGDKFDKLTNLKYLDISESNLEHLPNTIIELKKLEHLDISKCEKLEIDFSLLKELINCKYIKIKDSNTHNFRVNIIEIRKALPNCIIDTGY